ncbi:hypothetical protein MLD38_002881 [Melastoma candidum]|uniref:Uncharacterized protein n=1 Tax=Melastoma candidum TaxID=119954 RepID=A0ACB9S0T0_9MYRT|nr:hypothetical protein MLD38_002881 [Melastoma candidum]
MVSRDTSAVRLPVAVTVILALPAHSSSGRIGRVNNPLHAQPSDTAGDVPLTNGFLESSLSTRSLVFLLGQLLLYMGIRVLIKAKGVKPSLPAFDIIVFHLLDEINQSIAAVCPVIMIREDYMVMTCGFDFLSITVKSFRVKRSAWSLRVICISHFILIESIPHELFRSLGNRGQANGKQGSAGANKYLGNTAGQRRLFDHRALPGTDDELVGKIEKRISAWTFLPRENGRPLQYFDAESGDAKHSNGYNNNSSSSALNETIATIVLYLSDVRKGGQIHFLKTKVKGESRPSCHNPKEILRPVKGNAILFSSLHPDTGEALSLRGNWSMP